MICHRNDPKLYKLGVVLCKEQGTYRGYCEEHIPHKWKMDRDYNALPQETRQAVLDNYFSGITLGDSTKQLGIDLYLGLEVLARNEKAHHFVQRKAAA
jgi:hypothetical protein